MGADRRVLARQHKQYINIYQTKLAWFTYEIFMFFFLNMRCKPHFLPFSFVGHNQLWNLVPTTKSTNSSKSDSLPTKAYLLSLVAMHHRAICLAHGSQPGSEWIKIVEPYMADLRLQPAQLLDDKLLNEAYEGKVIPDIERAKNMGFPPDWAPPS